MDERRDLYEVLGVGRTATQDEIRKAYRQAALRHHPDRNNGDQKAAERFKEATEAFQVLSDDKRRSVYDQLGFAGLEGGGAGGFPGGVDLGDIFGNFQDLFSEFFGGAPARGRGRGPRRGPDLRIVERLTLKESATGVRREIALRYPAPCEDCKGSGAAPGTSPIACAQCRGTGQISNARGFVMFTAPCPACRGEGKVVKTPCPTCDGHGEREKSKKIVVAFPPGIDDGQMLRVPGQGVPGPAGGQPGDVLVQIELEPDPRFERQGADLITRAKVPFTDAILGGRIEIPAIDGDPIKLDVAAGTQPNHVVVVRGQGMPRLEGKGRGARGALHVVIEVEIPNGEKVSAKLRGLVEQLREELAHAEPSPAKRAKG
jgi:molecular chaperone DnaJ